MECEKCGTWNPDDTIRCWRCKAELPRPPEPRKERKINSQTWMWILVAAFILVTTLFRCNAFDMGGGEGTGFLSPSLDSGESLQDFGLAAVSDGAQAERAPLSALLICAGYSTMGGTS